VTVTEGGRAGQHIRPAGLDFEAGERGLAAGRMLGSRDLALAAAMNQPWLKVRRRPRVAVLATGDEVVMPGEPIGPSQIFSSNSVALCAAIEAWGGSAINLGIAPDDAESLRLMAAGARGADLLLTTGGVSVGEHDLVRQVLGQEGLDVDFWKIAMRPGKPLMFGRLGATPVLGLPGNPVSALVCSLVLLKPAMSVMLGLGDQPDPPSQAILAGPLAANDQRQDYLRARLRRDDRGGLVAEVHPRQDSSMLAVLVRSDGLVIRPPLAAAAAAGDLVDVLPFAVGLGGF